MQRVVLDTNVIISGILTPQGPPATILNAWRDGLFLLIVSTSIIEEVQKILNDQRLRTDYPHLTKARVGRVINLLKHQAHYVPGVTDLAVVKEDSDDDKFVVAAVEGEAQYIVSGDKHLARLHKYKNIRIVSPAEFSKRFR